MKKWAYACTLAAGLCAAPVWAFGVPAGTVITGNPSNLIGLTLGTNVEALSDGFGDIEFLSGDAVIGLDFTSDGLLTVYNNGTDLALPVDYSFTFDFAGLDGRIASFSLGDLSLVNAGAITTTVLGDSRIGITLTGVSFSSDFGSFTTQIDVPEPGSLALTAAALALLAGTRRRAAAARRFA